MDHKYYSIVEIVFTHIIVLSLAIWQLVSINREIASDRKASSPKGSGHPVGEHRLDDR